MTISVNLSARQLEDPGLVAELGGGDRWPAAPTPASLCLEVTEDTVRARPGAGGADAGGDAASSGSSWRSMTSAPGTRRWPSLRHLPLDSIKIHESFVSTLGTDPGEAAVVGALVELGHALGLSVMAEGVETDAQLAQLRDLGCDGAQGFLFSRPLPEDGVQALLGSGCTRRASRPQHEPGATQGPDQRRLAELAPQPGHVAVDDVGLGGPAPDLVDRALARDRPPGLAQQQLEQRRLAAGELDRPPGAGGGPRGHVEHQVGVGEQRVGSLAPPGQGPQAGDQLLDRRTA